MIQGGVATNIVPEQVILRGEVRSHSQEKLVRYTEEIFAAFQKMVADWQGDPATGDGRPSVAIDHCRRLPAALAIAEDAPVHPENEKGRRGLLAKNCATSSPAVAAMPIFSTASACRRQSSPPA